MTSSAPVANARSEVERMASGCPGLRLVVLFGSVARQQARPDSDVDVGVLGGGFWDGLRIGAAVGARLGREPQVVDLGTASDLLCFHVARDGILLYEGEPDAWARFRAESAVRYFDVAPIIALCAEGARRRLALDAQRAVSGDG